MENFQSAIKGQDFLPCPKIVLTSTKLVLEDILQNNEKVSHDG